MARSSRLSVCLAIVMRNSSKIHCARSISRQRATPWIAGIGPSSTRRVRKAACMALSLGSAPAEGILMRPSALVETDHPVSQRLRLLVAEGGARAVVSSVSELPRCYTCSRELETATCARSLQPLWHARRTQQWSLRCTRRFSSDQTTLRVRRFGKCQGLPIAESHRKRGERARQGRTVTLIARLPRTERPSATFVSQKAMTTKKSSVFRVRTPCG